MICAACGYGNFSDETDFIELEIYTIDYRPEITYDSNVVLFAVSFPGNVKVKLYACPNCNTVRFERNL